MMSITSIQVARAMSGGHGKDPGQSFYEKSYICVD